MAISEVVRKFCETTTIRGIGRAVKSESKFLFVVWWLSVTCCATLMAYQMYLVLSRYLRYDYVIVDRDSNERPKFPDITVCNIVNPLGKSLQTKSWVKHQTYIEGLKSRWTFEELQTIINTMTRNEYEQLWIDLSSPTGYYSNFPFLQTTNINKSDPTSDTFYRNTIVDIKVYDWSWTFDEYSTKYAMEKIQLKWNANYHHCYTLQIPSDQVQNIRAMSFIVYVDDFNSFIAKKFDAHPRRSWSTGIRVAIQERGTPQETTLGVNAGPGIETSIILTPVSRNRLEKPYAGCNNNRKSQSEGDPLYTAAYCYRLCLQNTVIAKCGCLASEMSFSTEQRNRANSTLCRNQTWMEYDETNPTSSGNKLNEFAFFNRIKCLYNTKWSYSKCIDQCDPPCHAVQYFTTNSQSSPWPHASHHLAFYEEYIATTDYKAKFAEYAAIFDSLKQNITSEKEALARVRKLDLIERNFLQVNVVLPDFVYTTLNEIPSMPNEVLLSNVGGVLSLWLGVTVMTIVEITEAIYFIIVTCCNQCRSS